MIIHYSTLPNYVNLQLEPRFPPALLTADFITGVVYLKTSDNVQNSQNSTFKR